MITILRILAINLLLMFSWISAEAQGLLHVNQKVDKKARKLYFEAKKALDQRDYALAEKLFLKAHKRDPLFTQVLVELGALKSFIFKWEESEKYYSMAMAQYPELPWSIQLGLAYAYWHLDKFQECADLTGKITANEKVGETIKHKALKLFRDSKFCLNYDRECAHTVLKLPYPINSEDPEYFPVMSHSGKTFYFTRRQNQREFFLTLPIDDQGNWGVPGQDSFLNADANQGAISFSSDGNYAVFARCGVKENFGECDLYETYWDGKSWSKPKNMGAIINTPYWESQPSLSADGRILFFSSNRPGGFGGKDLWYAVKNLKNEWEPPKNAGPMINTAWDEFTPSLYADGKHLYFASEGHPGFGGLDLMVSQWQDTGWGNVLNLGKDINTKQDETGFVLMYDGATALFSRVYADSLSRRMKGDIFQVNLCEYFKANPIRTRYIEVYSASDSTPLPALIELVQLNPLRSKGLYKAKKSHSYRLSIPGGLDFGIHIYYPGFLFHSENITNSFGADMDTLKVYLQPLLSPGFEKHQPIVLRNVHFKTGSAELDSISLYELNKLYQFLTQNPDIKIRILGHTDNVGSDESNKKLSQLRAESVRNFLITQGISGERVEAVGLGSTCPLASNDTAEGRAKNRRTEFEIIH